MTYKHTILLLIGLSLTILTINAQTLSVTDSTLHNLKKDTLKIDDKDKKDSVKIKKDWEDVKIEQRQMNNEIKRQLDILYKILDEKDKRSDQF